MLEESPTKSISHLNQLFLNQYKYIYVQDINRDFFKVKNFVWF